VKVNVGNILACMEVSKLDVISWGYTLCVVLHTI
jgi:hypothetical protein